MTLSVEEPTTTSVIEITSAAAQRVQQLLDERSLEDHALRVFVGGGGCSGLQYGMGLDGEPREDDLHFDFDGIQVLIDPLSMGHLQGAVIDYVDDLMGGGFKIENPNAVASCGCGHSFRTEGAAASGGSASGSCC
ncbi:MAG: iron-sulfur cluster insertion protein ErpA [Anaerolineales bacterium]|nr:iron-sulfur cluster insertion protein ErpA [Anaerolineales bacterium]